MSFAQFRITQFNNLCRCSVNDFSIDGRDRRLLSHFIVGGDRFRNTEIVDLRMKSYGASAAEEKDCVLWIGWELHTLVERTGVEPVLSCEGQWLWITRFPSEPYSDPFGASGTSTTNPMPHFTGALPKRVPPQIVVVGKGVEPLRPCGHMALNHARLPNYASPRKSVQSPAGSRFFVRAVATVVPASER